MNQLFDEAIMYTDIHYGLRGNSKEHNEECLSFTKWMIQTAKEKNIKTAIFLGDYFHNRNTINVQTLNYGIEGLRLVNEYFDNVYFIVGNHDMHFKNKRDVTSVEFASEFKNIHLINEITDIGNCTFVPFMVQDEWKTLQTKNPKYYFGHFELPGYKLNSLVEMPDHGKEHDEIFNCEILFSGHFHKRQIRTNKVGTQIIYIGNCFPHNFSDAWDDARGCVTLKWGGVPQFFNWPDAPKFRTADISEILDDPKSFLEKNTTVKATLDIDLSVEEIIYIKEVLTARFDLKEFNIVQSKMQNSLGDIELSELKAESVDSIVQEQINSIDSSTIEKKLLLDIYNNL